MKHAATALLLTHTTESEAMHEADAAISGTGDDGADSHDPALSPEATADVQQARRAVLAGIEALTRSRGVAREELSAWLRRALRKSQSAVSRRMTGSSPWDDEDLTAIARALGLRFDQVLEAIAAQGRLAGGVSVPAALRLGGLELEGELVVGAPIPETARGDLVARQTERGWVVSTHDDELMQQGAPIVRSPERYEVAQLRVAGSTTKRPRVALLDDEPDIVTAGVDVMRQAGLMVDGFGRREDLERAVQATDYDAFVLDWWVGGTTNEEVIVGLRESGRHQATPIFVVTGEVNVRGMAVEQQIARVVRRFDCTPREKPLRWSLLAAEISGAVERRRLRLASAGAGERSSA